MGGRNTRYFGERSPIHDIYNWAKSTRYIWGFIDSVNIDEGLMTVRTSSSNLIKDVNINLGACGPYHGIRTMPKKQDMVLLGVEYENNFFHVSTLPFKFFQWFEKINGNGGVASGSTNATTGNLLMRRLKEGETEISACDENGLQACSIALLQDGSIEMHTKHGSTVFKEGSSNVEEGYHKISSQDRTRLIIGQVERKNANGDMEIKAQGGVPYTGVGDALNEAIIKVGQAKNASGDDFGTPTASIKISDQLLDDNGVPILDLEGKSIQVDILMKSGTHIRINEDGKININEANPLTKPVKLVSRNGDNVETVISSSYTDTDHPGQQALALGNITQISNLLKDFVITLPIGSINVAGNAGAMTNPAPIVIPFASIPPSGISYVPSQTIKLTGEIVQGAMGVEIADVKPAPIPV